MRCRLSCRLPSIPGPTAQKHAELGLTCCRYLIASDSDNSDMLHVIQVNRMQCSWMVCISSGIWISLAQALLRSWVACMHIGGMRCSSNVCAYAGVRRPPSALLCAVAKRVHLQAAACALMRSQRCPPSIGAAAQRAHKCAHWGCAAAARPAAILRRVAPCVCHLCCFAVQALKWGCMLGGPCAGSRCWCVRV